MDVVGVHIVLGAQHRRTALQPLARMAARAVAGVDAGNAQDRRLQPAAAARLAQPRLGGHTPTRALAGRRDRAGLVEARARAVAIDAGGAAVDQPVPARRRVTGQRLQQVRGARVARAVAWRRCQMQHPRRQRAQPAQRGGLIQIADERPDAQRAQCRHARGIRGQRDQAPALAEQPGHALADIAAADDQQARAPQQAGRRGRQCRAQAPVVVRHNLAPW